MGQFEKLVVLAVLFVITIIVVLSTQEGEPDSNGLAGLGGPPTETRADLLTANRPASRGELAGAVIPLATAQAPTKSSEFSFDAAPSTEVARTEPVMTDVARYDAEPDTLAGVVEPQLAVQPQPQPRVPVAQAPSLLLNTELSDPTAPKLPAGALLRTTVNLTPTPHPDYLSYTVRSGDTYTGLAHRFYGASSHLELLRNANEGRSGLRTGETLLVPIFGNTAAVAEPAVERKAVAASALTSAAGSHEVQPGENLWAIASQHYGSGTRWKDVFEANRDLLSSPDALQAGMRLRIP